MGIEIGLYTLPPDPEFYDILHRSLKASDSPDLRQRLEEKKSEVWRPKPGALAITLTSWSIIFWSLYGVCRYIGFDVSRRLVSSAIWTSPTQLISPRSEGQSALLRLDGCFQHLFHPPVPPHQHVGVEQSSHSSSRRSRHLRSFQPQRSRRLPCGELASCAFRNRIG